MTSTGVVAEPKTIPSWGGRYEVLSLLGRGGTAEVFEATDRLLGRRVAVKVLREGVAPDPQAISGFRREARAAAALNHPSIVTVYDVGMDEDRPFIVMERVNGEPLSDVLDRERRLPPGRAAAIAQSIAEALACAHDAGIVHRDLKPRNVMLTGSGQVKVLDFGIAQALDRTPVEEPLGTAEYLSPEQAIGLPLDGRSDIYSLGVVLFEMLAGRPPFTGDLALAVMHQHVTEEPPPLARFSPEAPAPLRAIVDRCLRKDRGTRPRNARELAFELRRFRSGPDATDPLPPMRRTDPLDAFVPDAAVQSGRRRRGKVIGAWVVAGLALVLASLGLMVSLGAWARPVAPARPQPLRPPVSLQAQGMCDGFFQAKASLAWRPTGSRIADGYVVYRSEARDGPFEAIGTLPGGGVARYVDEGVGLNANYYYRLRATSGNRLSSFSGPARAETPFFCL